MESIQVRYRIRGTREEASELAESALLEQTVETPRAVAERDPFVRENLLGNLDALEPHPEGGFTAFLSLPAATAAADVLQLLNVLFGNASLHDRLQLDGFTLPPALLGLFSGPKHGIEGLRAAAGRPQGPLTCSALKPVGLGVEALVRLCRRFAEGGIDMIKDDHYLGDHPFCPFEERVRACQSAVEAVAQRTGKRTVYIPNLSGTLDDMRRQAAFAQRAGVGAVMVAPMLMGLPSFHALVQHDLDVPVFAHPSFGGALRIAPPALFGQLFRLFGADASIFANYGGRFSYPPSVCAAIADRLREPWPPFRAAFPVPAGGMRTESAPELVRFFGADAILLIGGSLLLAGDHLRERTHEFTESVRQAASGLPQQETR